MNSLFFPLKIFCGSFNIIFSHDILKVQHDVSLSCPALRGLSFWGLISTFSSGIFTIIIPLLISFNSFCHTCVELLQSGYENWICLSCLLLFSFILFISVFCTLLWENFLAQTSKYYLTLMLCSFVQSIYLTSYFRVWCFAWFVFWH